MIRWIAVIALFAAQMYSTECTDMPQREAYATAFAVVRGWVTKVDDVSASELQPKSSPVPSRTGGAKLITFRVKKMFKGPADTVLHILAFDSPSLGTGYTFHAGEEYVIYVTDDVPQNWAPIAEMSRGMHIYGIGTPCRLRVRTDIGAETRRLVRRVSPK